jgi:hypothetical protein
MQWCICVILVPEIWFFGTIVVQEVDKILTKHKSWESLPVWVKCCYYIMEASYEDDDLFSLVNCNLTSWLLQTYYGFQLLFVAWYVAKMWLRFCDVAWDAMILGYVKFEQGQKVLQYLDYGNHIIFLVVMSMCSWHIRCTNANRIMWCIKRLSSMRHGEHHSRCKGITNVCNVSFRFFFQVAQITLWLGNWDIPLPSSLHSTTIW